MIVLLWKKGFDDWGIIFVTIPTVRSRSIEIDFIFT